MSSPTDSETNPPDDLDPTAIDLGEGSGAIQLEENDDLATGPEVADQESTGAWRPRRVWPLLIGGGVILIGLSGLARNTGTIDHTWWLALVIVVGLIFAQVVANGVRRVVQSPS